MRTGKLIYLSAFFTLLISCSQAGKQDVWEEELIEADLAFSMMSVQEGANKAFLAFCAEDGVLLREKSLPLVGRSSIGEMLGSRDDKSFKLWWEPMHAHAAASGDLGYTYGIYSMVSATGGDTLKGTYVSIWVSENKIYIQLVASMSRYHSRYPESGST